MFQDAEEQEKKASDALKTATDVLVLFKKLEKDANDTRIKLEKLGPEVSMQTERIETAARTANMSQTVADRAGKQAEMLRAKLAEMDRRLRENGTLDLSTLDWIKQQLDDIDTARTEFDVDNVIAEFEAKDAAQKRRIANYDSRLTQMQSDLTRLVNINASIPAPPACFNTRDVSGDT